MFRPLHLTIRNIISFKHVEFEFRDGQAVVIVGDNRDNPSQRGNGSGKSAFLESLALAFTGKSVRDVKVRELINNDAESGEIELLLSNESDILHIKRVIHAAPSKSAEYYAWINKASQEKKYSDFNSFNAWVFTQLGISKDDFFNFYLLTQNTYRPFLSVGDTEKKAIINRFSGADKIDKVFDLITADSAIKATEIAILEKSITANQSKAEVYAEQLQELRDAVSPESKKERYDGFMTQLRVQENTRAELVENITEFEEDNVVKQAAIDNFRFTVDYDTLIKANVASRDKITVKINKHSEDLAKVRDKFNAKIEAILKEEKELNTNLISDRNELKALEQLQANINKQFLGLVECPKCHHQFKPGDKSDFDPKAAKKQLTALASEIKDYQELIEATSERLNIGLHEDKQAINAAILKGQESIRAAITELNITLDSLTEELRKLKENKHKEEMQLAGMNSVLTDQKARLTVKQALLIEVTGLIERITLKIKELENEGVDKDKEAQYVKLIEDLTKEEAKLKNQIELKTKEKFEIDAWETHFKNFKSHLANKSIKNIQDFSNMFLESMGTDLSLNIDGYKLVNKKIKEQITATVQRNGFDEGSFGKFSGGERGRINISVILAMQELINLNSPTGGLDLLVCDEILDQVDSLGLEYIVKALQGLGRTIMIVSQNEIKALDECTIIIRKENKVSTII